MLSDVLLPAISGLVVVPQHTPLPVIAAPPSLVIFPPLIAVEEVIEEDDTTTTEDTTTEEETDLTYDEEKALAQEEGIVTKEIEKETNKCEMLVMLARTAAWEVDLEETEDGFTDTPTWCKPYSAYAKEHDIVNGRTATTLGLDTAMNRFEFAVIIYRTLHTVVEGEEVATAPYTDAIVDWALAAVNWLHQEAIMTGYEDGTFGGAQGILKIEAAVALVRAR